MASYLPVHGQPREDAPPWTFCADGGSPSARRFAQPDEPIFDQGLAFDLELAGLSLNTDMVFRDDGAAHQLGTMGRTIEGGLSVQLSVPVGT
jgi:hypothetical protein